MRVCQYEYFSELYLKQEVLDFGGGKAAKYQFLCELWQQSCSIRTANISANDTPDFLLTKEFEPLPVEDGCFDAAVSINTLEHVYCIQEWLAELGRVLKPRGKFYFTVPYIFRTHGHPSDYNRFTPEGWRRRLEDAGFTDVAISALYCGPFSAQQSSFGLIGPFRFARKKVSYFMDYIYWLIKRQTGSGTIQLKQDEFPASNALAFYIECRKSA